MTVVDPVPAQYSAPLDIMGGLAQFSDALSNKIGIVCLQWILHYVFNKFTF